MRTRQGAGQGAYIWESEEFQPRISQIYTDEDSRIGLKFGHSEIHFGVNDPKLSEFRFISVIIRAI